MGRKSSLALVLALCLAQVPLLSFGIEQAGASVPEQEPLWSYETGGNVRLVAISSDGSYIAARSDGGRTYLFSRASSTPLWSYETGESIIRESVSISSDGSRSFIQAVLEIGKRVKDPARILRVLQ